MEFTEVVRGRRMIRRFRPDPVPDDQLRRLVELGLRAPSAGFSQGWDFVVLSGRDQVEAFWDASADPADDGPDDNWITGLKQAPALILCCSDKQTYLRRYAEPDKPWQDLQESHWPVPYWDVDTGMAAMIILLAAVDEGLGALFFGVPGDQMDTVRRAFGIPDDRGIVGVIALGHPERTAPSGSTRTRRRRPTDDVVHFGRFSAPGTPA
ncbi:nitroreductase family protein [Nakamurella lactea]|uniref:nitroreductase family protein n=1 Tax=Nakamurella lactea TaxID=459515 RepID=UPI00041CC806|nr:nitroreductase family protein [Nakamurella lactea]